MEWGRELVLNVSVALLQLKGEYDDQLKWPMKSCSGHKFLLQYPEGSYEYCVCLLLKCQVNQCKEIKCRDKFCHLNSDAFHLVNDCLTLSILFDDRYRFLDVSVIY